MKEFSNEIETLSYLIKQNKKKNINKEIKKFIEVCEEKTQSQSKIKKILMIVLPAIFIALAVLSLIGINPIYENLLKSVLVINLILAFANMAKSTAILSPIGRFL